MEALEELKAIIAGKPEGATHFESLSSGSYHYFKVCKKYGVDTFKLWSSDNQFYFSCNVALGDFRSISDIEIIIEFMEWQQSAFKAHPNIDLDIEALK
ncbi:MAG: hypothetical protein WA981_16470 [Glaciecola sp.]